MKMVLDKINHGSHSDESMYVKLAAQFDNCNLSIDNEEITISKDGKIVLHSDICLYEEDGLSITHKGCWQNGKSFRIVRPGKQILQLVKALGKETIVLGSMFSDGYAVTYSLK